MYYETLFLEIQACLVENPCPVLIWILAFNRFVTVSLDVLCYLLFISAKEVMFYPAFVCLSVCLSVCLCLLATSQKTLLTGSAWQFYQRLCLWTTKNSLNIGGHLPLCWIKEFFEGFSSLQERNFSTIWLIPLEKKWLYYCENFNADVSVDKEVPVGLDSLWQKSALSKCSCLLFWSVAIEVC